MFRWVLHGVVMVLVAGIVANYYHAGGQGYGIPVHPYVYYGVGALVAAVPVFWAVTHVCGGLLLGIASGGVLDGLKLGVMLGLGMAVSKLWPAAGGAAIGIFVGGGPHWYGWVAGVLAVLLFALDRILQYFWHSSSGGAEA